ncbi:MAG: hypothetical protein HQK59_16915, partial [Deltaproteobacteria bacterium]|nr:hypothetical protein [Deltaproteobacteria bacterium]
MVKTITQQDFMIQIEDLAKQESQRFVRHNFIRSNIIKRTAIHRKKIRSISDRVNDDAFTELALKAINRLELL